MKHFNYICLSFICCLFVVSCGSSINSGYFGKLPGLLKEKREKLESIDKKGEALSQKQSASMEDFGKLMDEYKKTEKEYDDLIMQEGEKLSGTPIAFSAVEGVPYEVSVQPTIKGMGKKGCTADISYTFKTTGDIILKSDSKWNTRALYKVYFKFVNKEDSLIEKSFCTVFDGQNDQVIAVGTELEGSAGIYFDYKKPESVDKMAEIDKIVFISEDEYNTL